MNEYWDEKIETLLPADMNELQLKRLRATARRCFENVPFYRRRIKEEGITPDDVRSLEDVTRLPITVKNDLRDNYPFKLFAVPMDDVVRIHASSGTSGKPTVVGYTQGDIDRWADIMARCLYMIGLRRSDIFQNAVNYGLFTGGLGLHYGAERVGAAVVPSGTGGTIRQLEMMRDFGVTAIHCTPSYGLYLAETAEETGIVDDLRLRIAAMGAEPWARNTRQILEEKLGIEAFDSYGLSELNGPGVAFECPAHDNLHIWDDHYLIEILDPDGEPVANGERGELYITSLTKEAIPLIRYKTGDITMKMGHECECGRTTTKLSHFLGRVDDMLIVRGINVFPSQIEHVLMSIPEVGEYFQVIVDRKKHLDELTVRAEMTPASFTGELRDLERIQHRVEESLKDILHVRTRVELVEKGTLPRTEGKSKKVIDLREL